MKVVLCVIILTIVGLNSIAQDQDSVLSNIEVTYRKTSVLVFPRPIAMADFGSPDIIGKSVRKGSNALKLKAAREAFDPTNLTIFTDDGRIYSINVAYAQDLTQVVHVYGDKVSSAPVGFDADSMTTASIELKAGFLTRMNHHGLVAKSKRQHVYFLLRQIYISDGKMFFVLQLHNLSSIPYHIQFARYFKRDAKRQKLTSHSEQEMLPLLSFSPSGLLVKRSQPVTLVAVFNQFTITDHKRFVIQLAEQNGDRGQKLVLKGKKILRAKKL